MKLVQIHRLIRAEIAHDVHTAILERQETAGCKRYLHVKGSRLTFIFQFHRKFKVCTILNFSRLGL